MEAQQNMNRLIAVWLAAAGGIMLFHLAGYDLLGVWFSTPLVLASAGRDPSGLLVLARPFLFYGLGALIPSTLFWLTVRKNSRWNPLGVTLGTTGGLFLASLLYRIFLVLGMGAMMGSIHVLRLVPGLFVSEVLHWGIFIGFWSFPFVLSFAVGQAASSFPHLAEKDSGNQIKWMAGGGILLVLGLAIAFSVPGDFVRDASRENRREYRDWVLSYEPELPMFWLMPGLEER